MILHSDGTPIIEKESDLRSLMPANSGLFRGYDSAKAEPAGKNPFALFWDIQKIPMREWSDRIRAHKERKTSVEAWCQEAGLQITNQARWSYCWCYGLIGAIMAAGCKSGSVKQRNPFFTAWLGKRGSNEGGWGGEAIRYLRQFGCPEISVFPGQPTQRAQFEREEVRQSAEEAKFVTFYELPNFDKEAGASCLIKDNPMPVTLGIPEWGHLVFSTEIEEVGRDAFGWRARNSWGPDWGKDGQCILAFGTKMAEAYELIAVDLVSPLA